MPKVYSYARVSTADQIDNTSLENQKAVVAREFEYKWAPNGYERGEHFEDKAVSGGKPLTSRKEGHRLNVALERGDVVIFAKLDRAFRSTKDLLNTVDVWLHRGIKPIFLDISLDASTSIGQMMLTIMGAVAQFERARLIERIRDGVAARRRSGKALGNPPWGTRWHRNGQGVTHLVVIPEDYEAGEFICRSYQQGHSIEKIATHLMRNGIERKEPKTRRGVNRGRKAKRKPWSWDAVRRTLDRFRKLKSMIESGKARFPKDYQPQQEASPNT